MTVIREPDILINYKVNKSGLGSVDTAQFSKAQEEVARATEQTTTAQRGLATAATATGNVIKLETTLAMQAGETWGSYTKRLEAAIAAQQGLTAAAKEEKR